MSIYDNRETPAYGRGKIDAHYCTNPHILEWWTPAHDRMISDRIAVKQWTWDGKILDDLVRITGPDQIDAWRIRDPLCEQYAWYNILLNFARSRAEVLGFTKSIRTPQWKVCPLCDQKFIEDSLPLPLTERLGVDRLDFCAPCLRDTVLEGSGNDKASERSIIKYLRDLAELLGRVPPQNFGIGMTDLLNLETPDRVKLLFLLKRKPTLRRVKEVYGSWLNALIQAKVLEDGTRRTVFGTQTIAKDGHVCWSLSEKTIDDWLYAHGVPHDREPQYPEGKFRADFKVGDVLIEYFGLNGNLDYDAKTAEKLRICQKHKQRLVAIYPKDLVVQETLAEKLSQFLSASID